MTEVADRYARVADGFGRRVEGVTAATWSAPSPCTEWTARDVVAHVVAVHRHVADRRDASTPPPLASDDDLVAAWWEATTAIAAVLADPVLADAPVAGRFAPASVETVVGGLLCADTVVHTWDLARATGQDERLDPGAVSRAFEALRPADERLRGPGGFGPKVTPPRGADEQTAFLCFLGRRV